MKVRGKNLVPPGPEDVLVRTDQEGWGAGEARILFGGLEGGNVRKRGKEGFEADVPLGLDADEQANVTFVRADGVATADYQFRVVKGGPRVISLNQDRIIVGQDKRIVVFGFGFGGRGRVTLGGRELDVEGDGNWKEHRIRARLWETVGAARDDGFEVPGEAKLVVRDGKGRESNAMQLVLDEEEVETPRGRQDRNRRAQAD